MVIGAIVGSYLGFVQVVLFGRFAAKMELRSIAYALLALTQACF
jgi:hypothetical protein